MHRWALAHAHKLAEEGKTDSAAHDFGVFAADLPQHVDGKPAPLPDFVHEYEKKVKNDLKSLADTPTLEDTAQVKAQSVGFGVASYYDSMKER